MVVTLEKDGPVGVIWLNNPDRLNVLSPDVLHALEGAIDEAAEDPEIRAVVIIGKGRAFSAGADVKVMRAFSPEEAKAFALRGQKLLEKIENLPKPVIAAINGYAFGGGCELAIACDIRVAARSAQLGQPEVKLGLIPGFGGTQRMLRLLGPGKAKYVVLTGETFTAEQAREWGIVEFVVEDEKLLDFAKEIARKIAGLYPKAVALAKEAVNKGMELPLKEALFVEAQNFGYAFSTGEAQEGIQAFLEKRKK